MRRLLAPLTFALVVLALSALPATRAIADEGGAAIAVHALLDAVDCTATPPTITILGLTIDISSATIESGNEGGGGEGGDGEDDGNTSGGCATLVAGQQARVVLLSDAAPLVATKVDQDGEDGVEIKAPIQAVDTTALTITLLGLTIDVSSATINGTDGGDDSQPIDASQLMPGEFADVHLDPAALPALVATEVEVRNDFAVKVRAPLDAVDCMATPPTITVLGLTIDISSATIEAGDDGEQGDDEGDGSGSGGCGGLVVGQSVRVTLVSDAPPFVATKVKQGDDGEGVEVRAPLQAVDANAHTITLLGLTIDASTATAGGGDDGDSGGQPIDLTQLMPGQFAETDLDPTKLPALVATAIQATTLGGGLDVEVDDPSGTEINDPTDDLTVDVIETTTVHAVGGKRGKATKTTLHLRSTARGSFHLSGLPAGAARISVTRVYGGVTMASTHGARMKGNTVRSLRLRLRRVR